MSELNLQDALNKFGGNRAQAAQYLGISERYIYKLLAQSGNKEVHFDDPQNVSNEMRKQTRRMYSNQSGNPQTSKSISVSLKVPIRTVKRILKDEKITHESSIFTEDELRNKFQDELTQEAIEVIESNHLLGFEEEKAKFLEKEYYRLRELERIRKEDLDMIADVVAKAKPIPLAPTKRSETSRKVLGVNVADWHVGFMQRVEELMRENRGYNLEVVRNMAREYSAEIIRIAKASRIPYEFVYIFDLGDVSEGYGQTDAGTPRAMDSSKRHIFDTSYKILMGFIEDLRVIAPIKYYGMPGNHNEMADFHLVHALRERYHECDDVNINLNFKPTESIVIGRSQFVMENGKSIAKSPSPKSEKHALVNITAFKEDYRNTDHHYYLVGHLHSNLDYESDGFEILRCPSPLGSDKYGESIGVQSRRQGKIYEIDLDLGVTSTHRIYFD